MMFTDEEGAIHSGSYSNNNQFALMPKQSSYTKKRKEN